MNDYLYPLLLFLIRRLKEMICSNSHRHRPANIINFSFTFLPRCHMALTKMKMFLVASFSCDLYKIKRRNHLP